MAGTLYALLVGIDAYQPPVPPLAGCVNDIEAFRTILLERVKETDFAVGAETVKVLTNEQATRQNIIDGFQKHLMQAGSEDVALFYYSGHGAQEKAPEAFWHLEPDHLDETLVCVDSRHKDAKGNEVYDLADKELGQLLSEIAKKDPHILVILDCCHSGSGTRAVEKNPDVRVRKAPLDTRERPLESFVHYQAIQQQSATRSVQEENSGWKGLESGGHVSANGQVVLAACLSHEEAKEYPIGGQRRGAFSYFLQDTLKTSGGLTYRDLFKRANVLVRNAVYEQSPQIEAVRTEDLSRPFLGGAVSARRANYTVQRRRRDGWTIDGGAIHGVPAPVDVEAQETMILALYSIDASTDTMRDPEASVGTARVTDVFADRSKVTLDLKDGSLPPEDTVYRAVIVDMPVAQLPVLFEGDDEGLALVEQALQTANDSKPSLYVRKMQSQEAQAAQLRLNAREEQYVILRPGDTVPLIRPVSNYTQSSAQKVVERLEHIARWMELARLEKRATSLPADAVQIDVYYGHDDETPQLCPADKDYRAEFLYNSETGRWKEPILKFQLTNHSDRRLYCALLELGSSYYVSPELIPGEWLGPGEKIWARPYGSDILHPTIDDVLWQQGVTEIRDTYKVIVSTEEFDASLLYQDALDTGFSRRASRGVDDIQSSLDRLLYRSHHRGTVGPGAKKPNADWTTMTYTVSTIRPLDAAPLQANRPTALGSSVTIAPHPALKAGARLTTVPATGRDWSAAKRTAAPDTAERDWSNSLVPSLLRDNPETAQLLEFTATRGDTPGLNVLELTDVEGYEFVSPDSPLEITLTGVQTRGVSAPGSDYVLPIGFDGEFYLPLSAPVPSTGGAITLKLNQLPPPLTGTRSLKGSIKILFHKIVAPLIGASADGNNIYRLAVADVDPQIGRVTYESDLNKVKDRVANAQNIVLYVHGILGDTYGMAASARNVGLPTGNAPDHLADRYDLILTYDYENLKTPIDKIASYLKERLETVGLGMGHNKALHIVAHSMGGLVSRSLIETQGGNAMVQRLVMLGTPNGGAPWSRVEDMAFGALTLGLNGLTLAVWPAYALSLLAHAAIKGLETIDVTLEMMAPDSDFLKNLNKSPNPGIPYYIVAGNTSLIPTAVPANAPDQGVLARLLDKVKSLRLGYKATAMAFFGLPNDLAVAVESISNVPEDRVVCVALVACDHLCYFSTLEGMTALAAAVAEE